MEALELVKKCLRGTKNGKELYLSFLKKQII